MLGALQQWGDEHRPSGYGPADLLTSTRDGGPARVALVDNQDRVLPLTEVVNVDGPGVRGVELSSADSPG